MSSRREVLTTALPLAAFAVTASSGATAKTMACKASSGGVSRDRYDEYIRRYNANDPTFIEFYDDDVVMETVPPLKGAATIAQFKRELATYVNEHISVEFYVHDAQGSSAQFLGEFTCIRDMPVTAFGGLFGKAVRQGHVLKQRGIILYGVRDSRFTFVRAGPPIILQDWS